MAKKANAAFMKPMNPSASLGAVIGTNAMPRTEVTKKIWAYIKKNSLQDSKNRRMINADDKLRVVFGGIDHAPVRLVLQAVPLDVGPQFLGDLGARHRTAADHGRERGTRVHRLHECCVWLAFLRLCFRH